MTRKTEIGPFNEVSDHLRRTFPDLAFHVNYEHHDVDAALDIPRQPGLSFDVHINLQNLDEIHLSAEDLWVDWFPCGEQEVMDEFLEALPGLLNGSYRILQHVRSGKVKKAELQRPAKEGWKTIALCTVSMFPWFAREQRVVQNIRPAPAESAP